MAIEAQLPGGITLQFPDGTPDAIVQGAVKQHLSQQPDTAAQTPESKLGLTPAPEEKPPQLSGSDPAGGVVSADGSYVPAAAVPAPGAPSATPAFRSMLGLPDQITPEQRNQIFAPTPAERVLQAAKEGWRDAPTLLPPESGQQVTPGSGLGVNQPLVTLGNAALGAGNAILRGGQAFAYETLAPYSKSLARDVAAVPEAFPTGDAGLPGGPRSYTEARAGSTRGTLQMPWRGNTPPPVTLNELTGAIDRVPAAPVNQMMPGEPAPGLAATTPRPASDTTGLASGLGQMGGAISDSLRDHLWSQLQKGDLTEAGAPSAILQAAKANIDSGAIKTRADFDRFYQGYGDQLRAQRTGTQQPQPAPQPEPTAAGAQITPASELGMTPAEEAAYRSTAEGNKLLEPQEPGVRDAKQYLPGERINEAEASQDVETARRLKSLRQQTPGLDAQMTADENFNNNLRYNAINNAIPGQVQITAARTARQSAMEAAEPKVFAKATDADVQPIVEDIQDILNDPKNRQNTQLRQYVRPLIERLVNPDGTPKITDPRELWSWRQDVQHLTSKAAQIGDPNLSRVSGILGRVLDTTDNQIEAAAPGYKPQLRDDYRTRSREIDAMEALNAERFKLFDSQNIPNYNAVQGLMRRLTDARQTNDPYEPFTHVQQNTLDQLWNIRDTMRRSRAADRLAAPKGSPTAQNLGDAMRAAGKMALQSAAPAIGATIGSTVIPIPGVGPALGLAAGAAVNHLFSERAMAQRLAEGRALLQPNQLGPQLTP